MGISYREWIGGNGCCGCPPKTNCDCDEIYLEISKLHTDDLVLQDQIDEINEKLPSSGGCCPSFSVVGTRLIISGGEDCVRVENNRLIIG